jgi:hypothetical protein
VYLPCEALRVLRTDASETPEEDGSTPTVSARATTKS